MNKKMAISFKRNVDFFKNVNNGQEKALKVLRDDVELYSDFPHRMWVTSLHVSSSMGSGSVRSSVREQKRPQGSSLRSLLSLCLSLSNLWTTTGGPAGRLGPT